MEATYIREIEKEFNLSAENFPKLQWSHIEALLEHNWNDFVRVNSPSRGDIDSTPEEELTDVLNGGMLSDTGYIYTCDNHWLWQKLVRNAAQSFLPHLALAGIYIADEFYSKNDADKLTKFYAFDYDPYGDRPNQDDHFMWDMSQGNVETLRLLTPAHSWLDKKYWPRGSSTFNQLLNILIEKVPEPEKTEEKAKEKKAQKKTVSISTENVGTENISAFDGNLPVEFNFLHYMQIPQFIHRFIKFYNQGNLREADRYLYNLCFGGQMAMRVLFLSRLLRLYCLFPLAKDDQNSMNDIKAILESLWLQVYELNPDFSPEKPYQVMLARWDPILYGRLLELTLKYSEKNGNEGFDVPFHHMINENNLKLHLASISCI